MQFNSFSFLVFLPVVFLLYWLTFRGRRWQNLLTVGASYVFYGWWDWRFLGLIVFTTLLSYGGGRLTERYAVRRRQRAVCAACIGLNLLILLLFKYYDFFADSLSCLLRPLGWQPDWPTLHVVLPVGISFYTFQAISYVIDVRRGRLRACRDVVAFMAYISFFPQLVAGPIERATRLLPQFLRQRRFDGAEAADGCRQMLWGLFKKMVVADQCAAVVNAVWADYDGLSPVLLLTGAVLFAFQIYGDFSGYSDIAIGCARLFGIRLTDNFRYPYFAHDIADFWRRWHISLMTWLRDYVYIPLGGSRRGAWRTLRNTFVVWGISGLWHGASWTFVCWGLYHAVLLTAWRGLQAGRWTGKASAGKLAGTVSVGLTFFCVVVGWVFFRAPTLHDAMSYLGLMLRPSQVATGDVPEVHYALAVALVAIGVLVCFEWRGRGRRHALQLATDSILARHAGLRMAFYVALTVATVAFAGSQSEFIYFQF